MYAGHDCTFGLALMSLSTNDVDKFQYTLDADDKQSLADWIRAK